MCGFEKIVLGPRRIMGGDYEQAYELPVPLFIQKPEGCNAVHVWNLHYDTTEYDLRNI